MSPISLSATHPPLPFSRLGFALVLLVHGVVLGLLLQTRSIAMPVSDEVLTLSILSTSVPASVVAQPARLPKISQPSAVATSQPLPQVPVATASINAPGLPTHTPASPTSAPMAPAPMALLTSPRFDADYLDNPTPPYPPMSRRLGEQGRVILRVHVLPSGQAGEIAIQTSSNSSRLDLSARETVSRWRFLPARRGEEAIAAWVLVPIAFSLNA